MLSPLDSEAITDRKVAINQPWTDLNDLIDARSLEQMMNLLHTLDMESGGTPLGNFAI